MGTSSLDVSFKQSHGLSLQVSTNIACLRGAAFQSPNVGEAVCPWS